MSPPARCDISKLRTWRYRRRLLIPCDHATRLNKKHWHDVDPPHDPHEGGFYRTSHGSQHVLSIRQSKLTKNKQSAAGMGCVAPPRRTGRLAAFDQGGKVWARPCALMGSFSPWLQPCTPGPKTWGKDSRLWGTGKRASFLTADDNVDGALTLAWRKTTGALADLGTVCRVGHLAANFPIAGLCSSHPPGLSCRTCDLPSC